MKKGNFMSCVRLSILNGTSAWVSLAFLSSAYAGNADVIAVETHLKAPEVYDFNVTIRSQGTGPHYYADRIEVVGLDGRIYGSRVLETPHDNEQLFTRDVPDVRVPGVVNSVMIRVHFTPTGYDGVSMSVTLGGR
jgi:hypothetical protein